MARRAHRQPIPAKRRPPAASAMAALPKPWQVAAENEKIVLHIGWASAAPGRLPADFNGWREVRYDLDPKIKPDYVGRPEALSAIPDESVDAVYLPQLLQRFPFHVIGRILNEARRVLKEGGMVVLTVPNAQLAASYVATEQANLGLYATPVGPIAPLDLLFGLRIGQAKGQEQHYHRSAYTPETIGLIMREMSFSNTHVGSKGYEIVVTSYRYAIGHPKRVEKVTVTRNDAVTAAKVETPPIPKTAEEAASIPRRSADGRSMPDELDLPPVIWKPLGLRK